MTKEAKKPQQEPTLVAYQKEIRKRTEEIFNERVDYNDTGDTLSDWLQAERRT